VSCNHREKEGERKRERKRERETEKARERENERGRQKESMEKCNVSNQAMENNMVMYKMAMLNNQMVYIFPGY
jgi:hypothetical protein